MVLVCCASEPPRPRLIKTTGIVPWMVGGGVKVGMEDGAIVGRSVQSWLYE